jgi:hypothetical protein
MAHTEPNALCVHDEATFLEFLRALSVDFAASKKQERNSPSEPYGPAVLDWENTTIDHFLESAAAWANDTRGSLAGPDPQNPWRRCAMILLAGKSYE